MRAQAWIMAGLGWLALSGGRDRPGLFGESAAHAQPRPAAKAEDRPAAKPGARKSEPPGEPPRRPESAPAASPGGRPPQVRTYSSVTVVDDPKQAPPLPGGRKEPPAATVPRPPTEPRRDEPPAGAPQATPTPKATDERPAPGERRASELRELRRDLRELRQEVREQRGGRDSEAPAGRPRLVPADADSRKHPERAPLRERIRGGRE